MANAMVWAVLRDGRQAKHITEVRAGLDCECVCAGCEASLEAVNSQNPSWKRRPHFRHEKAGELDSCLDSALLVASNACISEIEQILLPSEEITAKAKTSEGRVVHQTIKTEAVLAVVVAYEFVDSTDAVLTLEGGQNIYVRLIASAAGLTNVAKQDAIVEIVIDLSDPVLRTADRATLRKHISLSPNHRTWCRNQFWNSKRMEAQDLADQKAREYVEPSPIASTPSISGSYRYLWSASWPGNEAMIMEVKALLEKSPNQDVICDAIRPLERQPYVSPIDFAIQLETLQVPREETLHFLHKLHLVVRTKTSDTALITSRQRLENLRDLLTHRRKKHEQN